MAKPSVPSVGTRLVYYPTPNELPGGCGPLPALVISVAGSAPDYLGMTFAVFGADGVAWVRTGIVNIATGTTIIGANPATARWDFVDLSA